MLTGYKGMDVAEMTELRESFRKAEVEYKVVKNTLARRALQQLGIKTLDTFLVGPTGVVWSSEDSTAPARVL
ncbi:hypothetical protein LCGC14_2940210, partial [marine sediment metagenome]